MTRSRVSEFTRAPDLAQPLGPQELFAPDAEIRLAGERLGPPAFRQPIEILAAALPAGRVAVMPGQQHVAMDTAPDLFLAEGDAFPESVMAAAGSAWPRDRGVGQPAGLSMGARERDPQIGPRHRLRRSGEPCRRCVVRRGTPGPAPT